MIFGACLYKNKMLYGYLNSYKFSILHGSKEYHYVLK